VKMCQCLFYTTVRAGWLRRRAAVRNVERLMGKGDACTAIAAGFADIDANWNS